MDLTLAVALGSKFPPSGNGPWSTVALTRTAIASIAVIVEIKTMVVDTVHLDSLSGFEKSGLEGSGTRAGWINIRFDSPESR